jgi:hypothetical protein
VATFSERFGNTASTVLGIQATAVSDVTDIEITGLRLVVTGAEPKRIAFVTLTIDAEDFELQLEFTDETLHSVTLTGKPLNIPAPL